MKTKIVIAVLLLAFVIIFSIQNATEVEVVLFSLEIHTRRAVLIFSALYIGFIIGRFSKYVEPVIETKKRK
ncbi:MAG: putative integral membrane protein [Arenicella sp.]|jgi:uncharacterized integral membrane protein